MKTIYIAGKIGVLSNPVLFPEPIKDVKGKLSLWDYPELTEDLHKAIYGI